MITTNFPLKLIKMLPEDIEFTVRKKLEEIDLILGKVLPQAEKKLKKYRNELEILLTKDDFSSPSETIGGAINEAQELMNDYDNYLRILSYNLRQYTEKPCDFSGYLNDNEADFLHYLTHDKRGEGIEAVYTETNIFIRLPLLSARKGTYSSANNYFGKSVRRAMIYSESYKNFDPMSFTKYELFYLFVHNNRDGIIDADNYCTTDVTNAVTSVLIGGDTSAACSFRMMSVRNDSISEGTYVTVSPQHSPISPENVVAFWLSKP